jgi:hypothetical protein
VYSQPDALIRDLGRMPTTPDLEALRDLDGVRELAAGAVGLAA